MSKGRRKGKGMLVLARGQGEKIVIIIELFEKLITITALDIFGDKVRLAIDAPAEIRCPREGVYERDDRIIISLPTGETITILIVGIRIQSGKVRIGIDAPKGMPVHRLEVWKAILLQAAQKAAQVREF